MVVELSQFSRVQIKLLKSYIDLHHCLRREDRLVVFTFDLLFEVSLQAMLYNCIHAPVPYMPFPAHTPICIHPTTVPSP